MYINTIYIIYLLYVGQSLYISSVGIQCQKVVVIRRSNIVGAPTAMLLQRHNATVTVVDFYTKNPEDITREVDLVISAVGVANMVCGDWLKPGVMVIYVGINLIEDPNTKRG